MCWKRERWASKGHLGSLRGSDVGSIEEPSEKRRLVPPGVLFLQSLILRYGLVDGWVWKVPPP